MRSPLIAAALVLVAVLLTTPQLTAQRATERETVGEPHEVNRAGRDIVEYTSDRLQVVAVHYYFPEDNDPKWLLIDVAMDVRSGDPIRVARRDFSLEGPDGLRVPLSTLPAFPRAYRQLRPLMLQPLTRDRPSAGFLPVPCADPNFRFFVPTGEIRQTEVHASESENVTVPFSVSLLAAASAATNPGVQ